MNYPALQVSAQRLAKQRRPSSFVPAERGWYLTVEYRESRSRKFKELLRQARKCGSFQALIDETGRVVYRNLLRREQLADFGGTFEALHNLDPGIQCTIRGCEFPAEDVHNLLICARASRDSGRCREFTPTDCRAFHLGCDARLLFATDTKSGERGRYWWEFGELSDDGTLRPDRQAMKHYLLDGTFTNSFCPLADHDLAFAVIDALPERVDVRREFGWEIFYTHRLVKPHEELFARRWEAVPASRPAFGTQFLIRNGGSQASLTGFDGTLLGTLPEQSPLLGCLKKARELAGIVLTRGLGTFEFGLLKEVVPPPQLALSGDSFTTGFRPESTPRYTRFLVQLFDR